MRDPFSWIKRLLATEQSNVLALLTPEAARGQNLALRFALAGGTALGLGVAALIGLAALAALVFALAAIYYLSTQVLGLKIDVDPKAFYEQVQKQAQAAYGPN